MPAKRAKKRTRRDRWQTQLSMAAGVMLVALIVIGLVKPSLLTGLWPLDDGAGDSLPQTVTNPNAALAPFYAPEVMRWREDILRWAVEYHLNPNIFALIMQIESCGDPYAISGVGATGIMQVMPQNFAMGENMFVPDTNVRRGMEHFRRCLNYFNGDVGLALACYNGGFDRSRWGSQTQYYYQWGTGIWQDVVAGHQRSATLSDWLAADGGTLCPSTLADGG
jgi:soluble lytic murein transglycosylase-like protein